MNRKLPCVNLSMLWGVRVLFPHCDLNPQLFATSLEPIDRALLLSLFRNKRTEVTLLLAKLNDCIIPLSLHLYCFGILPMKSNTAETHSGVVSPCVLL